MDMQDITLSIPKEILLQIRLLAVRRNTSVSRLLVEALERLVQQEEAYTRARRRHLDWLEQGVDLCTGGCLQVRREDLHERV